MEGVVITNVRTYSFNVYAYEYCLVNATAVKSNSCFCCAATPITSGGATLACAQKYVLLMDIRVESDSRMWQWIVSVCLYVCV